MDVYLVFKTGVYRHECGGVFSTLERAREAAQKFLDGEPDAYHDYEISKFTLDVPTEQTPKSGKPNAHYTQSGGQLFEDEAVEVISRIPGTRPWQRIGR